MKDFSSPIQEAICPKCGRIYRERPALSREDGVSEICPDCGTREALESIGCSPEAQEHILDLIHEFKRRKTENEKYAGYHL